MSTTRPRRRVEQPYTTLPDAIQTQPEQMPAPVIDDLSPTVLSQAIDTLAARTET